MTLVNCQQSNGQWERIGLETNRRNRTASGTPESPLRTFTCKCVRPNSSKQWQQELIDLYRLNPQHRPDEGHHAQLHREVYPR
ncbi:hypothetical protein EYF80_018618 [Liparis tanakae]|uniref:Uncharacterized protein n=1 Tax=Liparis tanakae TaxID=230148 RepID=A0A4Z2HZJ9_9TELE|nr:hypothetical protein EYF80_018618 [Liparis tanakae]